jgi:hypothetical protein
MLSVTSLENQNYTFFQDEEDLSAERVSEVRFDNKVKNNEDKTKFKSRQKLKKELIHNKKVQLNEIERKLKENSRKVKKKEKRNKKIKEKVTNFSFEKIKHLEMYDLTKVAEESEDKVSISPTFYVRLF